MIRLWIKANSLAQALEFVSEHGLSRAREANSKDAEVTGPLKLENEWIIEIDDCDAALGVAFPKVLNWYAEIGSEQLPVGTLLYYMVVPE